MWKDAAAICATGSTWYVYYAAGIQLISERKYEAAVYCFSEVSFQLFPTRHLLILFQAATEGYENPCQIVQASRTEFTSMILHRRAYALYKSGQLEDALSDISVAMRAIARSKDPAIHYLATDIYLKMGSYAKALKMYKDGLEIELKGRQPSERRYTAEERDRLALLQQITTKPTISGTLADPFAHFPTDIIEQVMKQGLREDPYFALRCSWVSQAWRTTIHDMPSLWRTYTYNPAAKTSKEKRQAWARYADNRFNEIQLVDVDSKTAMKQINATWKPFLKSVQMLTLRGTTTRKTSAIKQLAVHSGTYSIRTLDVHGLGLRGDTYESLDLGLLSESNKATIEDIWIEAIDLRGSKIDPVEDELAYGALLRLTVMGCGISNGGDPTQEINTARQKPQTDPLHRLLRQAVNLEQLHFSCLVEDSEIFNAYDRPLILLDHLRNLRMPPPAVWTIDIKTPHVQHLAFDLRQSVDRGKHVIRGSGGLIPDLGSFSATGIDFGKLLSLELMLNGGDTKERLEAWLRGATNLAKLVIRSPKLSNGTLSQLSPFYSPSESKLEEVEVIDPANTANRTLISMLQDVGLCPRLQELHLTNVYVPEDLLLALVEDRRNSKIASEIRTLSLVRCTYLSSSANRQLARDVACYSNVEHRGISRLNWKQVCDRWEVKVQIDKGEMGCELVEDVKPK